MLNQYIVINYSFDLLPTIVCGFFKNEGTVTQLVSQATGEPFTKVNMSSLWTERSDIVNYLIIYQLWTIFFHFLTFFKSIDTQKYNDQS